MRINQNIAAFNAYRNLSTTNNSLGKSLEKLSSGYRINRAADDAAGLVKSEGLRAEIRGTNQAVRNAQDGVSLVQTAEGALNEVHSILQRMRELAVSAANTATSDGVAEQAEIDELLDELDSIGTPHPVLRPAGLRRLAPARSTSAPARADSLSVTISSLSSAAVGSASGTLPEHVWTSAPTRRRRSTPSTRPIASVSSERSTLGATQNRLEHTISNLQVASENLSASESRIRDTDMAQEMVQFTRSQILQQAGTAMLAQANQVPQSVLSLLR